MRVAKVMNYRSNFVRIFFTAICGNNNDSGDRVAQSWVTPSAVKKVLDLENKSTDIHTFSGRTLHYLLRSKSDDSYAGIVAGLPPPFGMLSFFKRARDRLRAAVTQLAGRHDRRARPARPECDFVLSYSGLDGGVQALLLHNDAIDLLRFLESGVEDDDGYYITGSGTVLGACLSRTVPASSSTLYATYCEVHLFYFLAPWALCMASIYKELSGRGEMNVTRGMAHSTCHPLKHRLVGGEARAAKVYPDAQGPTWASGVGVQQANQVVAVTCSKYMQCTPAERLPLNTPPNLLLQSAGKTLQLQLQCKQLHKVYGYCHSAQLRHHARLPLPRSYTHIFRGETIR
ncbi:hypothetical protein JB92DRAFT_3102937 [Gautieria morchelliformis]|nr:hypothetical protein JB92DRAFT_3102937 [Gautieria morchelliformis]